MTIDLQAMRRKIPLSLCDRCDYIADDGTVRQDGYTIDQVRAAVEAERTAIIEMMTAMDHYTGGHGCPPSPTATDFIAAIRRRPRP